jgi:2-iminobutanoate/2-iminopropanoate deaminase
MPNFPLSPIKKAGELYFVSGQIGIKDGQLAGDDIKTQLAQTIANIKSILEGEELSLSDIIDVTVFLVNQEDYQDFNDSYRELFQEPYPTRTTVTVKSLPANALVELKVIARIQR